MALILNIETSTTVCSVNLAENGKKVIGKETNEQNAHSKVLTVFIEELFKEINFQIQDIDAVAVSKGPGSYTGLRIGVSAAKGIAYGAGKPLISVSTLQNMAWGAKKKLNPEQNVLLAPMIDARRMEVYTQLFDNEINPVNEISAEIIDKHSFLKELKNNKIYFFGDGAAKCKDAITHNNAVFFDDLHPSADYMIPFSEKAFKDNKFEDVAYFEPFYLKDFVATIPTKNIFG
ncbi:MAG: tRNA (adenosine(37)-N6)-threonylcarbamoyltransferase complex dimerization subunit type 1 TsaB [Bacteroidales bacterium]|nr:tRNA (adenosine(37)-N6)-threonylcarbamoyltransferase complex dimerization subunit type 1 TsaB [Bacteroidales bacterium]